jgi:hypothetical protein
VDKPTLIKSGLLAFWAIWFGIVFLTNLFAALKAMGVIAPSWKFASRNYDAVVRATALYDPPPWVPRILFLAVIAWQLAAFVLFGAAVADPSLANAACGTAIALWAAFMLADEIVIKYEFERTHELLFIAQVATLIALHVL